MTEGAEVTEVAEVIEVTEVAVILEVDERDAADSTDDAFVEDVVMMLRGSTTNVNSFCAGGRGVIAMGVQPG